MALRRFLTTVTLAAALGLLVACDSAKERAEKHFEAGLEYIQAGDVDRALVEFRNVFQLDSTHREARRAYAEAERGRADCARPSRSTSDWSSNIPTITAGRSRWRKSAPKPATGRLRSAMPAKP